jgi:hypothetical protein
VDALDGARRDDGEVVSHPALARLAAAGVELLVVERIPVRLLAAVSNRHFVSLSAPWMTQLHTMTAVGMMASRSWSVAMA